jgi:hypothetical protein
MRNILLIVIVFVFLTSCSHRKEQKGHIHEDYVTIPVPEQDINTDMSNTIPLSTFIDKIDIIPLEFDDSCILGEIRKVAICGDNIFVLESQRPGTVYRFNMQGNFSNKIGSKGQGPEEVIELSDFAVNEEDRLIYLLDNYRQSVLSCTFDGEVKEVIKINQYADQLHYKNGLFYLFQDQPVKGELYSLVVRDIHGGIKERFFPSKLYPKNFSNPVFAPHEEGILFRKPMYDTIYFLRDTEMSRLYWVDFGSLRYSPQEIEDIYMERTKSLDLLLQKNRITSIKKMFQVGDLFCFNSLYTVLNIFFVYNARTQELKTSVGSLYDDLEYMFYGNEFCGQTEDALIGIYDSERIMKDINQYDQHEKEGKITKEQKERFQSKMNALRRGDDTENMNPWILLYHVKKD